MDRFARRYGVRLCNDCYNHDRVKRRERGDRRRRNRPEQSEFVKRQIKEWKDDEAKD